jgi:hypothetical protein
MLLTVEGTAAKAGVLWTASDQDPILRALYRYRAKNE